MNNILKSWNFSRVFRLILGLIIITQGIIDRDWAIAGIGLLFAMLPIFNLGCCAGGACANNYQESNSKPIKENEASFEEIHS